MIDMLAVEVDIVLDVIIRYAMSYLKLRLGLRYFSFLLFPTKYSMDVFVRSAEIWKRLKKKSLIA